MINAIHSKTITMKYLLIASLFLSCCGTKTGQQSANGNTDTSATGGTATPAVTTNSDKIALYFGSMASGPIGDEFLKDWLVQFNKNEKAAITADKFSACGKEGEYIIVIYKNGFDNAKEATFTAGLEKLVTEEVKKRKAENSSSGSVEIRQNPNVEDYSFCRLASKKWL